jgi:PKD repeat protein
VATLTLTVTVIPTSGPSPLTVYFNANAVGGAPPYSFEWSFGDGQTGGVAETLHDYVAGTYTAYCTVTDSNGLQDTSPGVTVLVSPTVPNATFTVLPGQVCAAGAPAPLAQIPAGAAGEIAAGPALEQLPSPDYYDRCLGEFIGADGVPVPVTVSSVANVDGTLSISPNTGDVIASLNLGHANTWTAAQTFSAGATVGGGGSGTLNIGGTVTLVATTVAGEPQLAINTNGSGNDYINLVASSGGGVQFKAGATVMLTANDVFGLSSFLNTLDDTHGNMSVQGTTTAGTGFTFNNAGVTGFWWKATGGGALEWKDTGNASAIAMALSTGVIVIAAGYTLNVANTSNVSDVRLKTDWRGYSGDYLAELRAAEVGEYRTMSGHTFESWRAGVAAQSLPESVHGITPDGYYTILSLDFQSWAVGVMKALDREFRSAREEFARAGRARKGS